MSKLFHIAIELTDDRECRRMEKILEAFNDWRLGKDRRITGLEQELARQHEAAELEIARAEDTARYKALAEQHEAALAEV